MPADIADYSYRKPIETAQAALAILHTEWAALPDTAHDELTATLAAYRDKLYRASGDIARGTLTIDLLYGLEALPSLPPAVKSRLQEDHRSRVRGAVQMFDGEAARSFIQQIDALTGYYGDLPALTALAGDVEAWPDAAIVARRVIDRLNRDWAWLSLHDQDRVFQWLEDYDAGLRDAGNDADRLRASYEFLHRIKQDQTVYQLVEDALTVRGDLGQGPIMTEQDANSIRAQIDRNPQALVPKRPWISDPSFALAESAPPETLEELAAVDTDPAALPTAVDFHTDVRFPGQVSTFDRNLPLRVRLTLEKPEASMADTTLSLEYLTPEPKQVLVVCNAEGFIVDNDDAADSTRTILVYMDRDSQWAVFLLTPDPDAGPGVRRISLDFVHQGRQAGTASFEVEVRDRPPIDQTPVEPEPVIVDRNADGSIAERVGGALVFASAGAPTPDFVLRITLSADRRRLSYTLHSPTGKLGLVHQRMGSVALQSEPRTFLDNTLMRLSQMARASREKLNDDQIAAAQNRLREIGWDLYEQLFTPQLRRAYRGLRRLREEDASLSLLIVSDEPWIPWEMVLPHEDDLPDEDFLCAQFRMTRWLEGRGLPEDFSLRQAQVVVPKSNLASVKVEQDYFSQQLPPTVSFSGQWLDTAGQVKAALRQGDSQWFHFACHGDFDYTRPDESALQLKNDSLTPSQIVGPMRTGLAISQPLVFLNACHTAEAGFSLTRMGGWAERFVRAGASAFVGSLWEVNDTLAAEFAVKFYTELLTGHTLGDAFHTARLHIRAKDDANPTWLAYTLYADPNGRVKPSDQ